MRNDYWTCSSFADWIRGTMKPDAATSQGWNDWRRQARQDHPIRFWIAEEGLDKLQHFIMWPIDKLYDAKYYINNRWVTGSHALTAHPRDIKPGTWQDVGNRFLPCLFNELVNFVEIEQAWHYVAWDSEAKKQFQAPWWATGWFRWRTWRSREAGLAYLTWASGLKMDQSMHVHPTDPNYNKPTSQALAALEILELYRWWTEEYPRRPDPYDASGWTALCARKRQGQDSDDFWSGSDSPEEEQESSRALERCNEIEDKYKQEEEDMMIRLIRIRESLWT